MDAFFFLLRSGLWEKRAELPACFPLSSQQWEAVYELARQHTVRGLVFRGICLLPEEVMPADGVLARWTACAGAIEQKNRQMNEALSDLSRWFYVAGLQPVVLKGQGIARLYAEPLLRECGDIDLYFPKPMERQQAERMLLQAGVTLKSHPDGSTSYVWKGVAVEHHPFGCDLQTGTVKRFLRQMELRYGFHEIGLLPGQGSPSVWVPSPSLNFVLLNAHILKHTLGRGIGLRQLCDLARFCARLYGTADRKEMATVCRLSGITRWTCLLQSFLVEYLGLRQEQLPMPMKRVDTTPLLVRVMRGGNFGQYRYAAGLPHGTWRRKVSTAGCFLQNVGFALRHAPREAACMFVQLLSGQRK